MSISKNMQEGVGDTQLHRHDGDSHKNTRANVALDASEDHLIVCEAGDFL